MSIPVVYAVGTNVIDLPTGRVRVAKGSHWPVDDPAVRAHPEMFSSDSRWGMQYTAEPEGYDAPIETATAAPGEKRSVRRPA